jgi:hypothetical protein
MCNCFTSSWLCLQYVPKGHVRYWVPFWPVRCPVDHEDTAKVDVSIMNYWRTMTSEVKYICPSYRSTVTSTDTPVAPLPYKTKPL